MCPSQDPHGAMPTDMGPNISQACVVGQAGLTISSHTVRAITYILKRKQHAAWICYRIEYANFDQLEQSQIRPQSPSSGAAALPE